MSPAWIPSAFTWIIALLKLRLTQITCSPHGTSLMAEKSDTINSILLSQGTEGITIWDFNRSSLTCSVQLSTSRECRVFAWSCHGNELSYCDRQSVYVLNGSDLSINYQLPHPLTRLLQFSPLGTYVTLWEPYAVRQGETGQPNLNIYKGEELVAQYFQKKQDHWCPQWTDDELVCARNVTNEIHFFEGGCPGSSPSSRLQQENLTSYSLSPGPPPYHIAVHIKGTKGAPSSVQLYRYPRVTGSGVVIANRSFYKADTVQLKWNTRGSGVLVLTTTDVDKTGASYYGEQALYYLSVKGDGNMVPLDKKGPVYCVEWSPSTNEFCVVYGFMPSKAALFNSKCDMICDFGITHRNTAVFNPQGNILCLAGFGNLRGNMEFWDMNNRKVISKTQASDSTTVGWCPDGVHVVTATTAPRLREGNGFKIWHFSGVLLQESITPPKNELWGVEWKPVPSGTFPIPDPLGPPISSSLELVTTTSKPKPQAYVPPALRGKTRPSKEDSDSSGEVSKSKRKRDAQKRARQQQSGNESKSQSGTESLKQQSQQEALATAQYILKGEENTRSSGGGEKEKRLKVLRKKLKQIDTLKEQQREGKKLEANQVEKLKMEESILQEISQLEIK